MNDQSLRELERAAQQDPMVLPLLRLAYPRAGILGATPLRRNISTSQKFEVAAQLGYDYCVGWRQTVLGLEWVFFTTNVAGHAASEKLRAIKMAAYDADQPAPDEQEYWPEFHKDSDGIWITADFQVNRVFFTKAFAGVLPI